MIDRFKALKKLDRKRLDAALMRIQGRPALMTVFNLVLVSINSLSSLKQFVKLTLSKFRILNLDPATSNDSFNFLPEKFSSNTINYDGSVLIVCEVTIPQCFRYRVEQKVEQLELLGLRCKWLNWTDYFEVKNQIHYHDIIIFYRIPGYPKAIANVEYASQLGKIVVYDTDDLIFDRQTLESYYQATGQLSHKEFKAVLKGADLYRRAIEKCQFALTTTPVLQEKLEELVGTGNAFILPNALDKYSETAVKSIKPIKQPGKITLFYGSGSKTHDEDFALIADVLVQLFDRHPDLQLVVMGYLTLPSQLSPYEQRVHRVEFLEIAEYLQVLSHADINLAPLKLGLFADCKSEIKWLEAANLKLPTVASPTNVYKRAISHGVNGYIAENSEDWFNVLDKLITDHELRQQIGETAASNAVAEYSTVKISADFKTILSQLQKLYKQTHNDQTLDGVKNIVIVNVLYAPIAMGGATVVAENIVNGLKRDYGNSFRVTVFTCDIHNIYAYQLKEYEHEGVRVTSVSVPVGPDVDLREYDANIERIFAEYIQYHQPDLIHFHSIQRLTASMLQAALDAKVPFVVTVHDNWWLSDHQFLVDKNGESVDKLQSNALIATKTTDDAQRTLKRKQLLITLLRESHNVIAVSDYQADLYKKNGIDNVIVNKNGVDALAVKPENVDSTSKVVIGYTGSVCHHKGFYFLKSVIENLDLNNIKIKVIDFSLAESKTDNWHTTEVEYLPKFNSENMADFYNQIDVLIAPSMWPESFGLITREAVLAGIWIVASDAGGLAEIIQQGQNGFKFEIGNASELTEIIKQIDLNPSVYKQRIDTEKVSELKINTVEQQISELVDIYHQVLNEKSVQLH